MLDNDEPFAPKEKSALAKELQQLKNSVQAAFVSRDRVPQPLFWSLFHSEINEIKQAKQLRRGMTELLGE